MKELEKKKEMAAKDQKVKSLTNSCKKYIGQQNFENGMYDDEVLK